MKQKTFAVAVWTILLALCSSALAQQSKLYRVGVITAGGAWYATIDGLRDGLKQLGLTENKNLNWRFGIPRATQRPPRRQQRVSNERKSA
jgi:hypothetical protein